MCLILKALSARRLLRGGGLLFEDCPIEDVVVLVAEGSEEDAKQLAQVDVVRALLKTQRSTVVKVHGKLSRISL